ncbi:hypothetical protein Tco_0368095 [Tanacetum coccineum]
MLNRRILVLVCALVDREKGIAKVAIDVCDVGLRVFGRLWKSATVSRGLGEKHRNFTKHKLGRRHRSMKHMYLESHCLDKLMYEGTIYLLLQVNKEQDDEFDFWTDSYASDDDEIPTKQVTQDIMEEISLTIDEAKLKKMADRDAIQRSTS